MARDTAYRLAEEKIEETRRSGATKLDLDIGGIHDLDGFRNKPGEQALLLTELPDALGELTQLQSLNLSYSGLGVLPNWLSNLTELRTLNIASSRQRSLPEWLGNLRQLQLLDLSNNPLDALPECLKQLINLKHLELANINSSALSDLIGQLTQLESLNLSRNLLTEIPIWLTNLTQLQFLNISKNNLQKLPPSFTHLAQLQYLNLAKNHFKVFPESLEQLRKLQTLILEDNLLETLPDSIDALREIRALEFGGNKIIDIPASLSQLTHLKELDLKYNPLNPELDKAYEQGIDAVKAYLRTKAESQIVLDEAKLILIGEGEVGKTCLMDALLDREWEEHQSTHGIQIKPIKLPDPDSHTTITLNAWDFGGQRVYRPTHQLFFSAPAVYLVVWKPREGPQQGFVKDWIKLILHREPSAKILVVATHGGPQQRQPDIDRQELWDLFGKETIADFFFVDSKPDEKGKRKGIEELKTAIAKVAAHLPEMGRSVPKSFADVRAALQEKGVPYLPLDEVLAICRAQDMDDEIARLFITISHRLGHLTHYEHDPTLRDIVILRPDWLATALSYVLDDEETRKTHGLVDFSRLGYLWDDPTRPAETRYPATLHRIFLRLMERFDLSYRVAGLSKNEETNPVSLIAQLVPDTTPKDDEFTKAWPFKPGRGDIQQTQICCIVDAQSDQSTNAEGLFYQLIVRLHRYSLGRAHYNDSVHWQRGLILDADYNGRALLRHIENNVHITVRAPYPERFLGWLTEEVKYLVESFWEGLRCEVTVPCLNPKHCAGLFEVEKLLENKHLGRPEQPCPICNKWQSIEQLLSNAPAATQPISIEVLERQFASIHDKLNVVDTSTQRILSQIDKTYTDLLQVLTDEAKEGPRLFSFFPVDRSAFNLKTWIREKFRLVLWCEHSRLPLPVLNNGDMKKGVYDLELEREWFKKASPYLKFLTGTLGMVLPVASSAVKLALDETAYKLIEEQLDFGKNIIDATLGETAKINDFLGTADSTSLEHGVALRSDGSALRELHALLKAKDPSFGGLVRVMNKRQEFLWVHEKFAGEY